MRPPPEYILMNIAITHTSPETIQLLRGMITDLGLKIAWTSQSLQQAELEYAQFKPDLLLLQLIPDGIHCTQFIRNIMASQPTTIIVTTDSVTENTATVFEAMSAGALDAFTEPSILHPESQDELKIKIKNVQRLHASMQTKTTHVVSANIDKPPLVAIGSSTGGPAALLTILKSLPAKPQAIIVIIQHMDDHFSQGMAKWLDEHCDLDVSIAVDNESPKKGHVYMAGTNDHLVINALGCFEYTEIPVDYPYRPSVNAFFESALTHWPNKLIGVLLTGMGRDGADGLLSLYNRGMMTIAQDENSCAVYGMPKAAKELNAVQHQLDINLIAQKILEHI